MPRRGKACFFSPEERALIIQRRTVQSLPIVAIHAELCALRGEPFPIEKLYWWIESTNRKGGKIVPPGKAYRPQFLLSKEEQAFVERYRRAHLTYHGCARAIGRNYFVVYQHLKALGL